MWCGVVGVVGYDVVGIGGGVVPPAVLAWVFVVVVVDVVLVVLRFF